MLIDWFTVGAQALNFLILVWLMKRFLYKPILHAIDEREKRIAAKLADAAAKQAEAEEERDTFEQENEDFDRQRAALLAKATEEAEAERLRLLGQAREAAAAFSARRHAALEDQARTLDKAIAREAQAEVFALARKALMDLAGASLEERMATVFTDRLRELEEPARQQLAEALRTSKAPALVRSAFELPASLRETIQQSLNEALSTEVRVRFETAPELVAGIEFSANGRKIAWSIGEHLRSLERSVGELLNDDGGSESSARPEEAVPAPAKVAADSGSSP